MMVDEITRRRWQKASKPRDHSPRLALEIALAEFDEGKEPPDHVIVIFGRNDEGGADATRFFQAGSYSHHGMMGLMLEGMHMIRESGD